MFYLTRASQYRPPVCLSPDEYDDEPIVRQSNIAVPNSRGVAPRGDPRWWRLGYLSFSAARTRFEPGWQRHRRMWEGRTDPGLAASDGHGGHGSDPALFQRRVQFGDLAV